MLRPKIGLDWDDVTAPFNSIAINMANEKYQFENPLKLEEVDSWENTGRASVIKEFYHCEVLPLPFYIFLWLCFQSISPAFLLQCLGYS